MNTSFDMKAVFIANALGIAMTIVLLIGNRWRLKERTLENKCLSVMIVSVLISCMVDPIGFALDGVPGIVPKVIIWACNTWLFSMNMICGMAWLYFIIGHLHIPTNRMRNIVSKGLIIFGQALLVINVFWPIVFGVDENNRYFRGPLFALYVTMDVILIVYSIIVYFSARRRGGKLKFMLISVFLIPVSLGMTIQSLMYGISVVWPAVAISMGGLMASLQNELIFRDKLTGLYNRYYLDYLRQMDVRDDMQYSAMMLDLNDFKLINDRYGHQEGDRALIEAARLIEQGVGMLGSVVRYAGDEYVVLLNTQDEEQVKACEDRIREAFEQWNAENGKRYRLSASIGSCRTNIAVESVEDMLNRVDHMMYRQKRAWHGEKEAAQKKEDGKKE